MMNHNNIPENLRRIVDLVAKWGINDDGYRDEQIENSTTDELTSFISRIDRETLIELNNWLSDEAEIKKSTNEYINYTCLVMAFDYAKAVIKARS